MTESTGLDGDFFRRLPKAELHVHLDGSLRPATMLDLARDAGVRLPARTPEELAEAMHVRRANSLEEYLDRYRFTIAVMQSAAALERIAYEFVIDSAAENVKYVEIRYCPALHTERGMPLTRAIESSLEGVARASSETGTRVGIIITALRTMSPRVSLDLARAAIDYMDDGVVAFDLAGAERNHPARDHARAFERARGHGLNCTCHAGEGDGPDSVRQAIDYCCAERIGHGTRISEDPQLEEQIIEAGIPLEVCLTSNVHTHTVDDISEHPLRRYFDRGVRVTLNTDSRLMDGITLSDEYRTAHESLGFDRRELEQLVVNGFECSFLPRSEKESMIESVKKELEEIE